METSPAPQSATFLDTIRKAGLTESQAKCYLALIEHGNLSPTELAEKAGETRTNTYMICDKLVNLGLALKKEGKKALYAPTHPSALESLAEKRRKIIQRDEQIVKNGLNDLISHYYEKTEMPGVRYLVGRDGQEKVYSDIIAQKQPLHLIRTPNEKKFFGKEILKNFIANRIKHSLSVTALTSFLDDSNTNPAQDTAQLLNRQFMPAECYTAPVEVDIYGSHTSFISYGDELTGIIIDNPHVAEAMRQIFDLARAGAQLAMDARPDLTQELAERRAAHLAEHQTSL